MGYPMPEAPMVPKHSRKLHPVKTSVGLDRALNSVSRNLRYDLRANRVVDEDGHRLSEMEMDLLVDLAVQRWWDVPTLRGDKGKRIWNAYLVSRGFDPLVEWFDQAAEEYPIEDALNPAELPFRLWPERIDPKWVQLVGWSWIALFRAVVARAYSPPVRWDVVPIIRGAQGCGKSTCVTNLLPAEWTNGGFPLRGINDFDASRKVTEFTEGKAILESSEMVGVGASTREAVKAFLSADTDRSTRKYAIQAEDVPRRWAIVGTTNDPHPIPYDPSGGRRWIVTDVTGQNPKDGAGVAGYLAKNRKRYWAWAVHRYRALGPDRVEETLGVPEYLAEAHKAMVERYMWTPPSTKLVGGF